MNDGKNVIPFPQREDLRAQNFNQVWCNDLNNVFLDVARYYERANYVATLGLWKWLCDSFLATIDIQGGQRVLDACAGTNAVGIGLLNREPDLQVFAIDRCHAMQEEGGKTARRLGMNINSYIGDVHHLPYPDNFFDVVTLQYASRHLRIMDVFREILRVLKPGGFFYHSDMLRPDNRIIETMYYSYLRVCLSFTAWLFGSGDAAHNCKDYFIDALRMFYSAGELSEMLEQLGYQDVTCKTILGGTVGFHKSMKMVS